MCIRDSLDTEFLTNFDLILGAEVCYSAPVAQELLSLMRRAFEAGVQHIMIADPGRPDFEENLPQCRDFCDFEILQLPGTANGKMTHLFSARTMASL